MCPNNITRKVNSTRKYQSHKIRSHPFKCISLPLWIIFFFIIYWFALVPLIYVCLHMRPGREWSNNWIYLFWLICFVIFVIILCLLIFLWKCNPNKKNEEETDELIPTNVTISKTQEIYPQTLTADAIKTPKDVLDKTDKNVHVETNLDTKAICNVKRRLDKKRPESVNLTRVHEPQKFRSLYYGETSPLSPRELFFFDLMKSAHESERSLSNSFIENERKANTLTPTTRNTRNKGSKEFFIANVTTPDKCTSEVFLFIENDKNDKKLVIRENKE